MPSKTILATGLPASPGAATGEIVFDADKAEKLQDEGHAVILVRTETSPEDIHGMHAADGILTARGGMTSHAAVVARGMGRPCVSGAGSLRIDLKARTMSIGERVLNEGRCDHYRRHDRRGHRGQGADAAAGTLRRFRQADGLGRRGAPHESAHQCRDAGDAAPGARIRRGGHRSVPHRAHVLRGGPHSCRARDDPGR